jgi:hypothetical protein
MNSKDKIASDFVPKFSASKLGELCGNIRESTKFRFLKEFKPFSEFVPKPQKAAFKAPLSPEQREEIKNTLDETLDFDNLTFDDKKVLDTFEKSNKEEAELAFLINNLLITDDEEEPKNEGYYTPESDEEKFIEENDIKRETLIHLKSANANRYVSNMRGRKMEKYILERINTEKNKNFIQNKSRKYMDFGMFKIVGIIDGICQEEKTILEIKTRSKFDPDKDTISNKEKKQALVYMHMHGCDKCLFVESGPNGQRKETIIEYDEKLFKNDILNKLEEFCIFARNMTFEEFDQLKNKYSK